MQTASGFESFTHHGNSVKRAQDGARTRGIELRIATSLAAVNSRHRLRLTTATTHDHRAAPPNFHRSQGGPRPAPALMTDQRTARYCSWNTRVVASASQAENSRRRCPPCRRRVTAAGPRQGHEFGQFAACRTSVRAGRRRTATTSVLGCSTHCRDFVSRRQGTGRAPPVVRNARCAISISAFVRFPFQQCQTGVPGVDSFRQRVLRAAAAQQLFGTDGRGYAPGAE